MMQIIMWILLFIGVAFISGCFETWIVKQCTWCGAKGKLTAISHYHAIALDGKQRYAWHMGGSRIGIIHENIVCKLCYDRWIWDSCFAGMPESVKNRISDLNPRP